MIVVHIGLRKCGSSSIQFFLRTNEEALRAMGVEYPRVGREGPILLSNHNKLALELRRRKRFDGRSGTLDELEQCARDGRYETLIVSSEMFEGCDRSQVERMKGLLGDGRETIRIVMVVRDLTSLIPSLYAQRSKTGSNISDFDSFFETTMGDVRTDYFATALPWAEVFGWENLRVRPLDQEYLRNGDLGDDFLAAAGLDLTAEATAQFEHPGRRNSSPGWKILEALRALYSGEYRVKATHPLAGARDRRRGQRRLITRAAIEVGERRGWHLDRGRYITKQQAAECFALYHRSVMALNEHLGDPLPKPADLADDADPDRSFLPDAGHIAADELSAFIQDLTDQVAGARIRG